MINQFVPEYTHHIKSICFCMNDIEQHTLCWSPIGGHWMLEEPNSGVLATYTSLDRAIASAVHITGTSPETWTITDNPYGG